MLYFAPAMSQFRTTFPIPESEKKISYQSRILMSGSCFTENIGNKLKAAKFSVQVNPFGIVFNPVSIAEGISSIIEGRVFSEEELLIKNNVWLSLSHHGSFSNADKEACLGYINNEISACRQQLEKADFLIITLGTAWVYIYNETGQIAANCHKIPQKEFTKRLLNVDEILEAFKVLHERIQAFNPGIQTIFTLSPVRHWRDGAIENQRSKALLHITIQQHIVQHTNCHYFPAYELMMDDLRDYRFYEADMIHPNAQASEYIWEKFRDSWIDKECHEIMDKMMRLQSAMAHRPLKPGSNEYVNFVARQRAQVESLQKAYPHIDLSAERHFFESR